MGSIGVSELEQAVAALAAKPISAREDKPEKTDSGDNEW